MKTFAFAIAAIVACVSCTSLDLDTQHVRKASKGVEKVEDQKTADAASPAPVSNPVASTPTSPPEQVTKVFEDIDGDGYAGHLDCDESSKLNHAEAEELCDGEDNDCDGQTDEGVAQNMYLDEDQDGYGGKKNSQKFCKTDTIPDGYVLKGGDCNDSSLDTDADGKVDGYWINPAATDICDGIDNDCDGALDSKWCVLVGMSKIPINISLPESATPTAFGLMVEFPTDATRTMFAQEFYFEDEIGKWWTIDGSKTTGKTASVLITTKDACGIRFQVATGNPASKWLCEGNGTTAKLDPEAKVRKIVNGTFIDVTAEVKTWSPPGGPSSGCSALLKFKDCK